MTTELDRLLAEKVMGFTLHYGASDGSPDYWTDDLPDGRTGPSFWIDRAYPNCQHVKFWHPTTDIEQAIMVAEKICKPMDYFMEFELVGENSRCRFRGEDFAWIDKKTAFSMADTPAMAISLAAKAWLDAREGK